LSHAARAFKNPRMRGFLVLVALAQVLQTMPRYAAW